MVSAPMGMLALLAVTSVDGSLSDNGSSSQHTVSGINVCVTGPFPMCSHWVVRGGWGIVYSCEETTSNEYMYIYVHNKCKLLCSLTERERAHVSSSIQPRPQSS